MMPRTIIRLLLGLAVGSAVPYALYTRGQPWISTFHRTRRKVGPPPKTMTGRTWMSLVVGYFLKASFTFSPASFKLDFAWSSLPSFSVRLSSVTLPAASLALPPRSSILLLILSPAPIVIPFVLTFTLLGLGLPRQHSKETRWWRASHHRAGLRCLVGGRRARAS